MRLKTRQIMHRWNIYLVLGFVRAICRMPVTGVFGRRSPREAACLPHSNQFGGLDEPVLSRGRACRRDRDHRILACGDRAAGCRAGSVPGHIARYGRPGPFARPLQCQHADRGGKPQDSRRCRTGATIRLSQLRIPLGRIEVLFLTHYHSDHTIGIPDLWLTGWLPTALRPAKIAAWRDRTGRRG